MRNAGITRSMAGYEARPNKVRADLEKAKQTSPPARSREAANLELQLEVDEMKRRERKRGQGPFG